MNGVFQKNLFFLNKFHPHLLEKVHSKSQSSDFQYINHPHPNIVFRKRAFHSMINPLAEAQNLLKDLKVKKGHMYIFFGIGIGYHIQTFLRLYSNILNQITVIAIEASPDAFYMLVRHHDISFLKGIKLFVGDTPASFETFLKNQDPALIKGYRIIKLRGAVSSFESYYREMEESFRTFMSTRLSDILTRLNFESLWIKNIIKNIPSIERSLPLHALKNSLKGKPALVIGAGPSLRLQLEELVKASPFIYIIAVDTVAEPLLRAGIIPDFIVTLDAQYQNFYDFEYIFTRPELTERIFLISDLTVYPGIPRRWKGKVFFSSTPQIVEKEGKTVFMYHPFVEYLKEFIQPPGLLECGGSVSTTAIEFALYCGAFPVIVTGLDLSYTDFITHVSSSPYFNINYLSSCRLHPLQSCFLNAITKRKLRWLQGRGEEKVLSDFILEKYLHWIESKNNYRGKILNLTDKGVKVNGIPYLDRNGLKKYFIHSKKKPVIQFSSERIIYKSSFQLCIFLKNQFTSAEKDITSISLTGRNLLKLVKMYPFLENIIPVAISLYQKPDKVIKYLSLFLNMCKSQVDRLLIHC